MDAIDRKILAELQKEGRLTVTELAERVSLSVAPCHRRLRELERTKAIRGYRAVIDPAVIGLGFEVLVQVTMDREDATTIARLEQPGRDRRGAACGTAVRRPRLPDPGRDR